MRVYGLRRRGGAANLHGKEGVEEAKEEEWSAASGEEEVAMAAALAAARRGLLLTLVGFGPGGHPQREGEDSFAPHVLSFPVGVDDEHALAGDVASRRVHQLPSGGPRLRRRGATVSFPCAAARLTPRACATPRPSFS
jgi:hypothetical protein